MSPTSYPNRQSCLVDAALASKFEVTVPKKITLSGSTKSGTYSVTCKGDIAGNESVSVVPDATFTMSQTEKATVQAAVTQEKTMFRDSDYTKSLGDAVKMGPAAGDSTGTSLTGSIAAPDLSAGAWSGAFNFTIGLKEVLDPVTLTDRNLLNYVDAETGEAIATSGDVVIPAVVKNKDTGAKYQVTGLDSTYQYNKDITSVKIPEGVKGIGDSVFFGCSNLTSVSIPASVTNIFVNSITSSDLGYYSCFAFSGCDNLQSIIIDPGNTVYDSRENCNSIIETKTNKLIKGCKGTTIPDGVTSIMDCAFDSCSGLTSVTIPTSVTSIGKRAFFECNNLTSVTIPDGVTSIGDYAFSKCNNLTSITIPGSVTDIKGHAFYFCGGLTSVDIQNGVTSIGKSTFSGCSKLTSVVIPDSVTSIGNSAFFGCRGLTSITIPDGVTSIGNSAFDGCSGLTSITIPDGVTSIGNSAFDGCSKLTSVVIPDSVVSIGDGAFYRCSKLTSITIPESVTSIGSNAFYECSGLISITVDSNNIVYDSRENCNAIIETGTNKLICGCSNTVIPASITSIGNSAFNECSGLTSITIPDSVISIGTYAFYGCSKLTSITIPNSVMSIGNSAFNGCSGLTSITIPDSVTSIESYSFYECSGLTSITIPDSVISIGTYAFYGCSKLTSITIPDSATSIGNSAFPYYTLNSIKVDQNNKVYDSREDCNAIIETSTNELINGCNTTTIPEGVTSIGNYALQNCNGLTSITIPDSVTSIGNSAFTSCSKLSSITYKGQAYTSKSALTQALKNNKVTLGNNYVFNSTALSN